MREQGLVHLYYGNGKGKTTAAMGLALRALGQGKQVVIVQFLKNHVTGEIKLFEQMEHVRLFRGKAGNHFTSSMTPEELSKTKEIHEQNFSQALELIEQGRCELLVLDEILDAVAKGLFEEKPLISLLEQRPRTLEVVLTGRKPSERVRAIADYITKMEKERHPFDSGIPAREGIEY